MTHENWQKTRSFILENEKQINSQNDVSPGYGTGEAQSHIPKFKDNMMAGKTYEEVFKQFLDTFKNIALYKHRYDVFRDFVTMAAITFRNAIVMNDELEQEYLKIIHAYKKDD